MSQILFNHFFMQAYPPGKNWRMLPGGQSFCVTLPSSGLLDAGFVVVLRVVELLLVSTGSALPITFNIILNR